MTARSLGESHVLFACNEAGQASVCLEVCRQEFDGLGKRLERKRKEKR